MEAPVTTSRPGAEPGSVRVSYVLSTRNRKIELEKTLQNIRQFLCPQDELIIADGGSSDGTPDLAHENKDIIDKFISAPDCGEAHGLNRAILASRGRYIKLLSDDDRIDPATMRYCVDYLEEHAEVDVLVAGGTTYRVLEDGSRNFWWQHCLPEGVSFRDRIGSRAALLTCGVGFLLRRDALALAGLFETDKKYVDVAYLVRLLNSRLSVRYLNCKLFEHRWSPASGSFKLDNDKRFGEEQALGLIALGDWQSVSQLPVQDVVRALRLARTATVRAALCILLFLHRLDSRVVNKVLGALVILIQCALRLFLRIRTGFAHFRPSVLRGARRELSVDQKQANASTNEFHIWDSRAW